MHNYLMEFFERSNPKIVKGKSNNKLDIKTFYIAEGKDSPVKLPLTTILLKNPSELFSSPAGTLFLVDSRELEGRLSFLVKILEDPISFGLELVLIKSFPDSQPSVLFEQITSQLKSVLFVELESRLNEIIAAHSDMFNNDPNRQIARLQDKNGNIKGTLFNILDIKNPLSDDNGKTSSGIKVVEEDDIYAE